MTYDAALQKGQSPWQLRQHQAHLALTGVEATADLTAPATGLTNVTLLGRPLQASVLGARHADAGPIDSRGLAEEYERGEDLVAIYEQTESCPFRTTLYWRAEGSIAETCGVTLDLIVSVQTNLLNVTPRLETRSWFADAEVVLFPPSADRSHLALDRAIQPRDLAAETEIGCILLRLAELDATYCELIHPSDWRGLTFRRADGQVELSWSLVRHFMEKGVIRRLRVRGAFLAGRAKEERVDELYADFVTSPPPLTT